MKKEIITTLNAPAPIGPYNQGIKVGNTLYISGQIPLIPSTMELFSGSIKEETQLVMEHLQAILEAAQMSFEHVVKSLSNAYKQTINKDPVYKCSTTTSDENYLFNNVKDIITFGQGNIESGVHGPNECIDIEKLINCTKIYALTILELDNQLYN